MSERFLSRLGGGILRILMFVYIGGMAISMLLFNYQYAREHGFMDWLVFGEVVPSLKATVWPYYLVRWLVSTDTNPSVRLSDTRDGLHTTDIPRYYPILLDHIRYRGPLEVQWTSQAGDVESLEASFGTRGSVKLRTYIPVGSSPDASQPIGRIWVVMEDDDHDGTVDRMMYIHPDGEPEFTDPAEDHGGRLLWDQCLAIAFMYGEPFQ